MPLCSHRPGSCSTRGKSASRGLALADASADRPGEKLKKPTVCMSERVTARGRVLRIFKWLFLKELVSFAPIVGMAHVGNAPPLVSFGMPLQEEQT
jgi:hypothetical protein